MTTLLDNPAVRSALLPISVKQYRRLGDSGILDERTELLRGAIVRKMNKSPLHSWTVGKLMSILDPQIPPGLCLRKEEPLTLSDSEPEPDLAIVPGTADDYRQGHPTAAVLVVEVAISSEEIDRAKASIYAEANVAEFWLVLPAQKSLHRFTDPKGGCYRQTQSHEFGTQIRSSSVPEIAVQLADLA